MATRKTTARKPTAAKKTAAPRAATKAPAKKAPASKTAAKKAAAKKAPAKKVAAKKVAAKKLPPPKAPARKAPAKKAAAPRAVSRGLAPVSRGLGAGVPAPALPADFFSAYTGELLTEADYVQAAQALACEVAAIKAVAEVETKGKPFDEKNRPTILYERHIFAKYTVPPGKFNASHPDLSANVPYVKYGLNSVQYGKFESAWQLDPHAALMAPSWGKFQILGNNHKACGHDTVESFVKAMTISEREHLRAFVRFVASSPAMLTALRQKDWTGFARRYNGPGYAANRYDEKMKAAYAKFAA